MIRALVNDIAQRVLTANKYEQKKNLSKRLKRLELKQGAKILDFGCGTALFAKAFLDHGLSYYGYDIDSQLLSYARSLYKKAVFTSAKKQLSEIAPFDIIVANCCFHHIPDSAAGIELNWLVGLLSKGGLFILVDLLKDHEPSFFHSLYMKLEQGEYLRTEQEYLQILKPSFDIVEIEHERSSVFSLPFAVNPLYNDLVIVTLKN